MNCFVVAGGRYMGAARRPGEGVDFVGVGVVHNDVATGEGIPDVDSFVIAARGYTFAIGRPGKGFYGY